MTASPVGPSGVSGPVDGRSVGEIRADLAAAQVIEPGLAAVSTRLLADVPQLLAEVEAAHRFEVSAAAESAGLANRLNGVAAERDSLRGVVQAVRAKLAEPDKWHRYEPRELGEAFLVDVVLDWRDDVLTVLAAGADAPQPEPEKITYGPRVPSRRVDLGEWDSHRPDFLPDSSSSPVQPADPPTCEHGRTVAHQMPNTYALVICPGPSPAVLPQPEQEQR